jgi:sulfate/thiosulfate transport system ATP-binding protein
VSISVQSVTKRFGSFAALNGVSLEVPSGSLIALLGPSGCGKTTLLRVIAGLETPDSGTVSYNGEQVTARSVRERNVGFVFQHYALFRHMTVFENVAFGLRVRRQPDAQVRKRVLELLHLVRLEGLEDRYPSQLSGGQRQRVALARALAAKPQVLLLDEPFGALDARVRQELRQWLRRLHDEIRLTSIFVTHDQEEAFEVADRVVILRAGQIEQEGSPRELFDQPANHFVMDFLGNVNVFHGRVHRGRAHIGNLDLEFPDYPHDEARPATLYVRPHELDVHKTLDDESGLRATVVHLNPAGSVTRVHMMALEYGFSIQADISHDRSQELELKAGDVVQVAPRKVRVFVPEAPGPAEDYVI